MKRREFIALLGGSAAAWPLAARAQLGQRMRRIGVLMGGAGSDPVEQARLAAFLDGLQQLGWTDGRNVRIDTRWPAGDGDRYRTYAAELVGLAPDVILASASARVTALQQASRSAPIVFANVIDPVGAGFVAYRWGAGDVDHPVDANAAIVSPGTVTIQRSAKKFEQGSSELTMIWREIHSAVVTHSRRPFRITRQ